MRRRLSMASVALVAWFAISSIGGDGAGARAFPDEIGLPGGFAPEGIATGRGATFYTGSLSLAGIWRGDYRTGEGALLVDGGGPFVGMAVDARNRLWVAGGPAGMGYVFDADTGANLETFAFTTDASFVNDVVVTTDAAYFTDSFRGIIYRVSLARDGRDQHGDGAGSDRAGAGRAERLSAERHRSHRERKDAGGRELDG